MASFRSKKNVIDTFARDDDYIPTDKQEIVKYIQGRGNNLHLVENYKGESLLVSMPKKFRSLVWLRPGNTIVIDPIAEGKKVVGEIFCVLELKHVLSLIKREQWPNLPDSKLTLSREGIRDFFASPISKNEDKSNAEEEEEEDSDDSSDDDDYSTGSTGSDLSEDEEDEEDSDDDADANMNVDKKE